MAFKVGDRVRVVNLGRTFPYYDDGAKLLNLTNWKHGHEPITEDWEDYDPALYEDTNKATVLSVIRHPANESELLLYGLLMHDNTHFIVEERGIELYREPVLLEDSLFEV